MKEPILELREVYKRVGEEHILRGINLTIYKGEFVALVGPSGSGKSSLLYIMGLLDSPSEGEVLFQGEKVDFRKEEKLSFLRNVRIGFVFQFHYLIPELSLLENVMLPALKRGMKQREAKEKALYLLEKLGLKGKEHRKPYQVSGGEQQRTAIARALINDPSLLLADEPTGNLDSTNTSIVMDIFRRINAEGTTVVMVTHEMELVQRVGRVVEMKDGRLVPFPYDGS